VKKKNVEISFDIDEYNLLAVLMTFAMERVQLIQENFPNSVSKEQMLRVLAVSSKVVDAGEAFGYAKLQHPWENDGSPECGACEVCLSKKCGKN
jgi:hypothetical protein